jgi:hypothetical protein
MTFRWFLQEGYAIYSDLPVNIQRTLDEMGIAPFMVKNAYLFQNAWNILVDKDIIPPRHAKIVSNAKFDGFFEQPSGMMVRIIS